MYVCGSQSQIVVHLAGQSGHLDWQPLVTSSQRQRQWNICELLLSTSLHLNGSGPPSGEQYCPQQGNTMESFSMSISLIKIS